MDVKHQLPYFCDNLHNYNRFKTRVVQVGQVAIGGNNPIRVQSMTTTDTMDTKATVDQAIRMIEAGCELVRITAPSMNEARNLEVIKKELVKQGYNTPLIADIHFTPNAAEFAAKVIEKVRVNPGNYADKKKFENIDYSDSAYEAELERIRERFTPLVKICKEHGTAMRIGTNHGSLSDRIMSRYGDTPLGMVESALEFVRICEENNYYELVLSMKASNPQVMVQAYRLLVSKMKAENMNYPLHLGVTEAGDGEDGRIKSAVGIGTLLEDGLGDTIRVSLTEDPEFEIPVAKTLVDRYHSKFKVQSSKPSLENNFLSTYSPYEFKKRETHAIENIGEHNVPRVIADYSSLNEIKPANLFASGYNYSVPLDKWNLSDQACDYIYTGKTLVEFETPGTLGIIYDYKTWLNQKSKPRVYPLFTVDGFLNESIRSEHLNFIRVRSDEFENNVTKLAEHANKKIVLIAECESEFSMKEQRELFLKLNSLTGQWRPPVIVKRNYRNITQEQFQLYSSTDIGSLLLDGFGDGVWINAAEINQQLINSTCFGILQATRSRISKTEYISCPSCGRTLFDLQETTAKIRKVTDHLKGIKIGIMGCIVNGPGEMADADYGYVGTGVGKITLYKGREVVRRNIDSTKAVDELIDLIKEHGDWVEKV